MCHIPCKNGHTVLSIISFIFLSVSTAGLSMTINEDYPFLQKNREIMIPFLSTVCGISGLLFIFTFLNLNCICRGTKKSELETGIDNTGSLYGEVDTSIPRPSRSAEQDPLLYPKIYHPVSDSIKIPKRTKI